MFFIALPLSSLICLYHLLLLQFLLLLKLWNNLLSHELNLLLSSIISAFVDLLSLRGFDLIQLSCNLNLLLSRQACLFSADLLGTFCLVELFAHSCNVLFKLDHLSWVALDCLLIVLFKFCSFWAILVCLSFCLSRLLSEIVKLTSFLIQTFL